MAVPEFQSLTLPLLRLAADGKEHVLAEARDALAAEFGLSDADRKELLPSGRTRPASSGSSPSALLAAMVSVPESCA